MKPLFNKMPEQEIGISRMAKAAKAAKEMKKTMMMANAMSMAESMKSFTPHSFSSKKK
jgi:hypothetical protein